MYIWRILNLSIEKGSNYIMSLRIGIILPKDIREDTLDEIRKKYNLGLIKFNNKHIQAQIEDEEQFFQFSKHGIDSHSGIGAYSIYLNIITGKYKDEIQKKEYEETSKEIVNFITETINIYKLKRLGIIYFNGYTSTDKVKFGKLKKVIWNIKSIDEETIMKLEGDTINYFQDGEVSQINNNSQEDLNVVKLEEEPEGKVYKKLIEYACKINNIIKFKIPNEEFYEDYIEEEFGKICKLTNMSKEYITNNYNNEKVLKDMYLNLKDNRNMIWSKIVEEDRKKLIKENASEKIISILTESTKSTYFDKILHLGIGKTIYDRNFKILEDGINENIRVINNFKPIAVKEWCYNTYSIKINDKIKEILLQYHSLYALTFPNLFEDIEFFRDDYCWMEIDSRAKICLIYPNNDAQKEYLRNIGLIFD